ncbi:MAG: HAMP domain-containing sensor histidine kinase [Sulfurovaceae bacterium]|nr:HAMP domain-containing sensor histidine kinase [Sulfurovaceae bacterium]
MSIINRLNLISLLPILIMIGLAGYPLWNITMNFDANNQNQLITIAIYGSVIFFGLLLLIYGYITSNQETKNTTELVKLFNGENDISALKLDTYEGRSQAYAKLENIIDSYQKNKSMVTEIGTYLDIIIGFSELMKNSDIDEEQQEFILIIEKSSENILAIIDNILQIPETQSNKINLENIVFDSFEEFESILKIFAANASDKNINFNFYIDPRISPKLNGDLDKIKEIMINLLSNAIEFTNPDGEINVELNKINEEFHENVVTSTLLIKVQDNGVGMTQEQQELIFESFSKDIPLDTVETAKGFGLVTSNKLARSMGGDLEVESSKDIGTTFYLTFPIEEITIENSSLEDAYSGMMIGLYESDDIPSKLNNYIEKYLKFFGTKVKTFQSINKLDSLREKNKCKFCLIDIDKAEPEIIEALTKTDKTKLIPISQPTNTDKLLQLGFNDQDILLKPVSLSDIKAILSKYMATNDTHPASLENETHNDSNKSIGNVLIAKTIDLENKIVEKMAQNMGYTTTITNDPEVLLDALQNGTFDIVITDEETIEKIDADINEDVKVITNNILEELASQKG